MGKKSSGLLGIKQKSEKIKEEVILYNSNFDYEKFELNDLKNDLIKSEEKIFVNLATVGKATFEIAEELYKVNNELAKKGNGTYMAWCSSLGINKDKSSVLLKKYDLYLETNRKEIMELPIPVVKTLTSKNNSFTADDMLTIIEAEKPTIKLKEIEKRYSQVANNSSCEIEEAEIIVTEKIEEENIILHCATINKEDLLSEKEILRKDIEELNKRIEEKFNRMCDIDDILTTQE